MGSDPHVTPFFRAVKIDALSLACLDLPFNCCSIWRMSSITFDTHKFVRKLKESGFDEKQAEALTDAMQDAIADSELVTKRDLQIELAPIKADINLVKWMLGAVLAIAIANFAKQFL
jgi:hypothetical protein